MHLQCDLVSHNDMRERDKNIPTAEDQSVHRTPTVDLIPGVVRYNSAACIEPDEGSYRIGWLYGG